MGILPQRLYSMEWKLKIKLWVFYIKEMQQEGITVEVKEVGLLLSKKKPFLGQAWIE